MRKYNFQRSIKIFFTHCLIFKSILGLFLCVEKSALPADMSKEDVEQAVMNHEQTQNIWREEHLRK